MNERRRPERGRPRRRSEEEEDRPRRRPPRRGKPKGGFSWHVPLIILMLFVVVGGIVGAVAFFVNRAEKQKEENRQRFIGTWSARAPEAEWMTLTLRINSSRVTLTGRDTRDGHSKTESFTWEMIDSGKDQMRARWYRNKQDYFDRDITFLSDRKMRVQYVGTDVPPRIYEKQ